MNTDQLSDLLGIPKLTEHLRVINNRLNKIASTASDPLKLPLKRSVMGGKRLRPVLVIAAASCLGAEINDAIIDACVAIELIHISSLVHDDIIDKSAVRHNTPTVYAKEGADIAILAGDFLLAQAQLIASNVSSEFAKLLAATFASMCEGQAMELIDRSNLMRSKKTYLETISKKTALLFAASCKTGAILAGASKAETDHFEDYGQFYGLCFQLADDLLDILSSQQVSGKSVGTDLKEGIYTMPLILALEGEYKIELTQLIAAYPLSAVRINQILNLSGAFDKTRNMIKKYVEKSRIALESLNRNDTNTGLARLSAMLLS